MPRLTTVFQNGNSQGVRIPKEFRVDATKLEIRRVGQDLILSPVASEWPSGYIDSLLSDPADESFVRPSRTPSSERDEF